MAAGSFIIPEVYKDLAQASFAGKVKVFGSPAVLQDDELVGQPGETIHFPKWDTIADELDELSTGTAMTPAQMGTTDSTATIKEAGKAVAIKDRNKLTMLGDPQSEAVRQFGVMASRKVDSDLIAEATSAAGRLATTATATTFGWSAFVEGVSLFGDEWEPEDFAGVYIHSNQLGEAFNDPQFIEASKLGDNSVVRRGVIGTLGGVPVLVSNRVGAGQFLLMKQQVLGCLYKRRPVVETDRDVLAREDIVTTNVHYAVKAITPTGIGHVTLGAAA